jgi:hypothetical protein
MEQVEIDGIERESVKVSVRKAGMVNSKANELGCELTEI